jgi:DNA repair protein RadA/Sms
VGKCPSCGEWNTLVEEVVSKPKATLASRVSDAKPVPRIISEIEHAEEQRLFSPDAEFNRTVGGGIVKGSVTLIGGEPGIGKSTLLLQLALH